MHDVCSREQEQETYGVLGRPSLHNQLRSCTMAMKPRIRNRRISYPNRWRGLGVLLLSKMAHHIRLLWSA